MGSRVRASQNDDPWCLDGRADSAPYQLSGVDGSLPRLEEIPEYAVWPACPSSDGQHDGDILPEQRRRDRSLNQLARDLTLWFIGQQISLMAVNLAGVDNVEADYLSHH